MTERIVTAFAPATVSNVACGFDVLGFALHEPGDQVTARWAPHGVHITDIAGDDGRLPREASRNTAGGRLPLPFRSRPARCHHPQCQGRQKTEGDGDVSCAPHSPSGS